jgi:predicted HAD superfamily phosphohydrolase YqeG
MPYFVTDKADGCSGWATVKGDGEVIGCHKTKVQAVAQMVAVSLAEELEPGGERKDSGPQAVIVDIDGTLIENGRRVEKVYNFLDDMTDTSIFIVTGRNTDDRDSTIKQLDDLSIDYNRLFMNPGSTADTADFKRATAESLLKEYNVILAIDNNATMRKVYRDLGITALNVPDVPAVPSDEDDSDEERKVTISVPVYMRAAARRGLELNRQGFGGDGLTDKTLAEARAMADGRVSEDKWRRIGPWISRHLVDLDAPKNNNPDDPDYPGAGLVAHLLWGSGPTKARAITALNYAENVVEKLDEKRHLPGGHDQSTHGRGVGGNYKAGNWTKATEKQKYALLEDRYGKAIGLAQVNQVVVSREKQLEIMAKLDKNDLLKSEVYVNGDKHSVAFKRGTKGISAESKQLVLDDVDNLMKRNPVEQMDVEIVSSFGNAPLPMGIKPAGYTTNDGLRIVIHKDYAFDRVTGQDKAEFGIVKADPKWHMPVSNTTASNASYTMAHEWGHAFQTQASKSGFKGGIDKFNESVLSRETKIYEVILKGTGQGGFMSNYGKKSTSEGYAEAFAEFHLTGGSTDNPVVAGMAKEFGWK